MDSMEMKVMSKRNMKERMLYYFINIIQFDRGGKHYYDKLTVSTIKLPLWN